MVAHTAGRAVVYACSAMRSAGIMLCVTRRQGVQGVGVGDGKPLWGGPRWEGRGLLVVANNTGGRGERMMVISR